MSSAQAGKEWRVVKIGRDSESYQDDAEEYASSQIQFDQHTDEVESEEKNESPGHRGEKRAVPKKERADGAGGCAKRNKNNREAGDKRESRSKQAGAGNLALAELLHADPGEHGDVPGNKRQNTGREKRDKPGEKSSC